MQNFGETVRNIVEGETKVSKLPKLTLSAASDSQAENLRQMFVAPLAYVFKMQIPERYN